MVQVCELQEIHSIADPERAAQRSLTSYFQWLQAVLIRGAEQILRFLFRARQPSSVDPLQHPLHRVCTKIRDVQTTLCLLAHVMLKHRFENGGARCKDDPMCRELLCPHHQCDVTELSVLKQSPQVLVRLSSMASARESKICSEILSQYLEQHMQMF